MSTPAVSDDSKPRFNLEQIVAECDRFEASWSADRPKRIEEVLARSPESLRSRLFDGLLDRELGLRRSRGEQPNRNEYRLRFPDRAAAVDAAFRAAQDPTTTAVSSSTVTYHAPSVIPTDPESYAGGDPVRVPGYRIIRRLGQGGMGTVYEAEESGTGRRVALKLITPHVATSPYAVDRFRREGRIASGLDHPRCVFVLKADFADGLPYIIMELMPGETLRQHATRQGALRPDEAVLMILDVIEGLHEAHRLGVVHRDIKPSNCFLTADGRVKLGDFGLAKSLYEPSDLSASGQFIGTPDFASPEQIKGLPLDARADLYSVAATLYALLAGHPPFRGHNPAATLARVVSEDPPPIRASRPDVPESLERIVLRGMNRDCDRRWADLEEFRMALLPFAPGRVTPGTLGLRLAAFFADVAILSLPFAALNLSGYYLFDTTTSILSAITSNVAGFAYHAVSEGVLGWSPGKHGSG